MNDSIRKVLHILLFVMVIVFVVLLIKFLFGLVETVRAEPTLQPDYETPVPDMTPLECGIQRPTPWSDYIGEKNSESGLTIYRFDSNHDGRVDVQIATPTGDENRYPLFYSFDRDYDGDPDITYIDRFRNGDCVVKDEEGNVLYDEKGQISHTIGVYWTQKQGYTESQEKESSRHEGNPVDCVTQDCDSRSDSTL
jgi:hypothetical protein